MEYHENALDFMRLVFMETSFEWNKYNIRNLKVYSKLPINTDDIDEDVVVILKVFDLFIKKSKSIYKNKARGGIAVYLIEKSPVEIDIISNDFKGNYLIKKWKSFDF